MKHRLWLVALLFFAFSHILPGQSYPPMLGDSSTRWFITQHFPGGYSTGERYTSGDTSINGKLYQKVYNLNNLRAIVREDTAQKKMYMIKQDTTEFVLNDFSLSLGDTFVDNSDGSFPSQMLIVQEDSVNTLAGLRRRLKLDYPDEVYWIEGVGCTAGIFYLVEFFADTWQTTNCVYQDSTHVYGPVYPTCDYSFFSAVELPKTSLRVNIFPTIASEKLSVVILNPSPGFARINIQDAMGKILSSSTFDIGGGGEWKMDFSVENFSAGAYFIRIENGVSQFAGKFFRTH